MIFDKPLPPLETSAHGPIPLCCVILAVIAIVLTTWLMTRRK